MPEFMEEYEKQFSEVVCIPNIEMNRPIAVSGPPGDVGLELEIEGENLPTQGSLEKVIGKTSGAQWHTKTDGSLRGEALEYVLSTPCKIDEVDDMINGLYSKFTGRTAFKLSNRCSTHVHVNMVGNKVNEITSAIALWTAFEEPLTIWAGEERINNHFCLTSKNVNQGTVAAWRGFLRSGSMIFGDNLKYNALNILTLQRFGSLEYRVMNGSEDAGRIIDWTKFIFAMTRYAGTEFNNPRSLLYAMSERGGQDMFRDICERAGVSAAFVLGVEETVPDMNRTVLDGFRRAQPLVAGFDWDAWMPEIEKKYVVDPFGRKKKKKKPSLLDLDATFEDFAPPRPLTGRAVRVPFENAVDVAPVERDRPAFVPRDFVYNEAERTWDSPRRPAIEHSLDQMRIELTRRRQRPDLVEFVTQPLEQRIDWSRPVMFANGTGAVVLSIQADGEMARVAATRSISDGVNENLMQPFWYNTSDGRWAGGGNRYALVVNG